MPGTRQRDYVAGVGHSARKQGVVFEENEPAARWPAP
jgi:hypothetical protein